jgi:16S rRNA (guanine527-N7)-methyltransferase
VTGKGSGAPLDPLFTAMPVLLGRGPTAEERRRFSRYLALLLEWDRVHDLTGLSHPQDVVRILFLDSLLFLTQMPERRPLRVVDIGSGAGIPGVPLRIVDAGLSATLIESRRKRVSFLATVRRELGLDDMEIREGRAESLLEEAPELRRAFDCALVRGVRPTPALLTTCLAYLRPGGICIVSGPPVGNPPLTPQTGMTTALFHSKALGIRRLFLLAQADSP